MTIEPVPLPTVSFTKRQREIFEYLREVISRKGYAPSIREIGEKFGITSPNGVLAHLRALERKGVIVRDFGLSRAIKLRVGNKCPHCGKEIGG